MKEIIIGTTNQAKIDQIHSCLKILGINAKGVEDKNLLPEVIEDGKTVRDNAVIKALAYSKALGQRVLSMDNALFFYDLTPENQPGLHVRRIHGRDANTDHELLEHFQKLVTSLGGRANVYWDFGVCVADPDGRHWETNIISPRVFTAIKSEKVVPGYPLESLQIVPETGEYISEMSKERMDEFWQEAIGKELNEFVSSI